jgi:signal transduction histidine kinase
MQSAELDDIGASRTVPSTRASRTADGTSRTHPQARAHAAMLPVAGEPPETRARYVQQTADTVRAHIPWAAAAFLATYACVSIFELAEHPQRWLVYLVVYAVGAVECALAIALTRAPSTSPTRALLASILVGVGLIVNTTFYHIYVGGEAEVLAIANLYLMIGFLVAFPAGGWPQLAVAAAACAGTTIGLLTTVQSAVNSGIHLIGMISLGGLSVASAVLTDRSRHRLFRVQEELTAAKEAAEAASRARRDFVASVSHDLRTPVNIIFGMSDMALDVAVNPEQRELVETIKRAAAQLHALLNDLLDFSKIDAGVVDLAPRRFTLRPWLDGALEPHARGAAMKGVELTASVDAALPETVVGDPDRLRQVVGNLAGNAVKFTDCGRIAVRLLPGGDRDRPALRCEVSDTGIGIRAEDLARLFQPFSRAPAVHHSHGGTGLGLAICQRLIAQMGGAIGVDSSVGAGTTFWFSVPLT